MRRVPTRTPELLTLIAPFSDSRTHSKVYKFIRTPVHCKTRKKDRRQRIAAERSRAKVSVMRGASGGRLLAWGARSASSWWQTGTKGLSTAANTDLKAVLSEKIPEQQVWNSRETPLASMYRCAICIAYLGPGLDARLCNRDVTGMLLGCWWLMGAAERSSLSTEFGCCISIRWSARISDIVMPA